MVWENNANANANANGAQISQSKDMKNRHKVMGFVGIFTGFGSVGRRRSLRQTWLPSDRDGLQRYKYIYHPFFFFSFYYSYQLKPLIELFHVYLVLSTKW